MKYWLAALSLIAVWLVAIRVSLDNFYSLFATVPDVAQPPAMAAPSAPASPVPISAAPPSVAPAPPAESVAIAGSTSEAPTPAALPLATATEDSGFTAAQIEERLLGIYDPRIRAALTAALED